ncbi:DUF1062 domain-containing protein [uncultured Roseibium sp.]|uniref:DUF1062 domain-containing protein n=1 Tax=uncultured Roseibium sp. TaxID=1936171 RepID=UPI003450C752
MSSHLHFEWTVLTAETPHLIRPCGRCGSIQSFASTGKFRLNANGNRLDAWLIYTCLACGRRWNRAILHRRPINSVSRTLLLSLQENDIALARKMAMAPPDKSDGEIIGRNREFTLEKRLLTPNGSECHSSRLTILNPSRNSVRLDRLLAAGLTLPRSMVHSLAAKGALTLACGSCKGLKRKVGQKVEIGFLLLAPECVPDLDRRLTGNTRSNRDNADP